MQPAPSWPGNLHNLGIGKKQSRAALIGILRFFLVCCKPCTIVEVFEILESVRGTELWDIPFFGLASSVPGISA